MPENEFDSECQQAIFNFLFGLIQEYKQTMSMEQAVKKACGWLESLASQVSESYATIQASDILKNLNKE